MSTEINNQSDIKSTIIKMHEQLQNTIALGVIAAGSDFDNHDKSLTDNYWNITLDHLHQTDLLCKKAMEILELPATDD